MDAVTAIKTCFRNYVNFSGTAGRAEYWWFFGFTMLLYVVTTRLDALFGGHVVSSLSSLAVLVPGLAAGARRLHETGRSGWFQLLWIIPVLGWGVLIYFLTQPAQSAE